jgi:hypothetical protein
MKRRKIRRSGAPLYGTLQNPEAHKNGMSWEEAQALRKREIERDRAEAKKILTDIVVDLARQEGIPIPWEQQPAAPAEATATEPENSKAQHEIQNETQSPEPIAAAAEIIGADSQRTPHSNARRPLLADRRYRRPRKSTPPAPESKLERHARKCAICRHKDREEIEEDFLHWHDPEDIYSDHNLRNARVIYRHARATGLYERRMLNLRDVTALLAARADSVDPSGATIMKAVRACSLINERGEWLEPPMRVIHYAVVGEPPAIQSIVTPKLKANRALPAAPNSPTEDSDLDDGKISNRHLVKLECDVTSTKQTEEALSNRS